jgi:hypothetical protein
MVKVNKLEDVRAHSLAFDIMLFLSNLVLLQSDIAMGLTGTLSHLCKMNYITRYIVYNFRVKEPTPSCKLVHLGNKGGEQSVWGKARRKADTMHPRLHISMAEPHPRPSITSGARRA